VKLTAIDEYTAEIGLKHGGRDIGFARRVLSPDGKRMTMTISMGSSRNVAVYDKGTLSEAAAHGSAAHRGRYFITAVEAQA
jgi:hypothetical protein